MKKLIFILAIAAPATTFAQSSLVFPILGIKTLNRSTGTYDTTLSYQRKLVAGSGVSISSGSAADTISSSGGGGSTITCDSFSISGDDNTVEFSHSMTAGYIPISSEVITSQNDVTRTFIMKLDHHWSGTTFYIDLGAYDGTTYLPTPTGITRTIQVCYLH